MTMEIDINQQINLEQERLQQLLQEAARRFAACPLSAASFEEVEQNTLSPAAMEKLEAWVLELNTWYYQSFHRTFFPFYKTQISAEISRLFDVRQDQETLEKNILFVYKYDAQMYNQLMLLSSHIADFRRHLQQLHLETQQATLRQSLKFYNQMQELNRKLQQLSQYFSQISGWSQKVEVRLAFKQFPGHFSILPAIRSCQPADRKSMRFLTDLQLQIQIHLELMQRIKKMSADDTSILWQAVQNARREAAASFADKKLPLELRSWHKQYFCLNQQLYLQNLENAFVGKKSIPSCLAAAEAYEAFLNNLLIILQDLWLHPENNNSLQEVIQYAMAPYNPDQDQKNLRQLLTSLQNFLKTIEPKSNPALETLLKGAAPIMQQVRTLLETWLRQSVLGNGTSLLLPLQETISILSTAEFTFDEISESAQTHHSLSVQTENLLHFSGQYQRTFDELRDILNRQLQPRQIERSLKGVALQIERWELSSCTALPEDCAARMEALELSHRIPSAFEQADGDLFLLQIGSLCECILPHFVKKEETV